jgi:hypothetical protein
MVLAKALRRKVFQFVSHDDGLSLDRKIVVEWRLIAELFSLRLRAFASEIVQAYSSFATKLVASCRGCSFDAPAGREVRTTQTRFLAGSAHAMVPVDPVCPKVAPEQPGQLNSIPTSNPSPRDSRPAAL